MKVRDSIIKGIICLCAFSCVAVLIWLILYIVLNGIPALNLEFFQSLIPSVTSTLAIIGLTLVFSVPIGIMCAIYLTEYARSSKVVKAISFAVDSLSGIPSILYGLFGMTMFVTLLSFKWSLLSGSLTLAIMILPVIIRVCQESLITVPPEYKEGSFAMGATRLKTLVKIVLPCTSRGIVTAIILSIGRIVGETAAVYLTAGMVNRVPESVMDSGRTLSVHLYMLAKEAISFEQAFGTATVLIVIILIVNTATNLIVREKK